jgi:hypothetical protein
MHATIESPPNAILVYQTYFKLSAYAHLLPISAAWTTAAVKPGIGTVASFCGAVRYSSTKVFAELIGRPASTAYNAIEVGSFEVILLMKML